jgi:hypothetical protein
MFALTLQRVLRRLAAVSTRVVELAIAGVLILGLGLSSSWYMVEAGTRLTTARIGPWTTWTAAARPDADPYTRAHFANAGTLAVSSDVQRSYVARFDSAGERLHSSCDYQVDGRLPRADWWSIAVFDQRGRLIPNAADRHAFTSQTIALAPNGGFGVALAREARPGNWLPTGGAGRLAVVLTLVELRSPLATGQASTEADLPRIVKLKCR